MNKADSKYPVVLVVEDDPDLADVLVKRLEALPADVFRVASGDQAIDSMLEWRKRDRSPHLIILDMRMQANQSAIADPQLGLLLLAASFQLFPRTTPVIVYTGYETYENCVACVKLGAFDYIPKVISGTRSMDLLVEKCRDVIYPLPAYDKVNEWIQKNQAILELQFKGKNIAIFRTQVARAAGVTGIEIDDFTVVEGNTKEDLAWLMIRNSKLRWEKPRILSVKRA